MLIGRSSIQRTLTAEADLNAKLALAGLSGVDALYGQVYSAGKGAVTGAAKRGTDLHFEKIFYNGRSEIGGGGDYL